MYTTDTQLIHIYPRRLSNASVKNWWGVINANNCIIRPYTLSHHHLLSWCPISPSRCRATLFFFFIGSFLAGDVWVCLWVCVCVCARDQFCPLLIFPAIIWRETCKPYIYSVRKYVYKYVRDSFGIVCRFQGGGVVKGLWHVIKQFPDNKIYIYRIHHASSHTFILFWERCPS